MGAKAKSPNGARGKKRASKRAAKAKMAEQHRYYPDSIPPAMAHEVFDVSRIDDDGLEVLDDDEVERDPSEPVSPRASVRPRDPSRAPHPPRPSSRPPPRPKRSSPVPMPLDVDDLRINTPLSYAGNPSALLVPHPPEANASPSASTGSSRTLGYLLVAAVVALLAGMVFGRHRDGSLPAAGAEARRAVATPVAPGDGRFSRAQAESAIDRAIARAKPCRGETPPTGPLVARLTFAQTGQVVGVDVSGPLAGTEAGACFAAALREARVPSFEGGLETLERTVAVP